MTATTLHVTPLQATVIVRAVRWWSRKPGVEFADWQACRDLAARLESIVLTGGDWVFEDAERGLVRTAVQEWLVKAHGSEIEACGEVVGRLG